ncbi:DUF2202 domain-containing protein [Winogradskyella helgolandensis]|uniref:DUF2202 domain-containing protein n=1 Tax=Winogradskyella helgolandensis TaxID=2697010 RepID=UPI0015C0E368|nr:DUF2202 domain-containing protein [Winogradskyella helgolandensis]
MNQIFNKRITGVFVLVTVNKSGQQSEISVEEMNAMKYMVEEEKVARDVYYYLDGLWNARVFSNIKQSEERHMQVIKSLLDAYNITYKLSEKQGIFYNIELQKLYDELIEKGKKSLYDAFEVGKQIELTDIADLEDAIEKTEDDYIKQVYNNLLAASQNHLKAFNRQLSRY